MKNISGFSNPKKRSTVPQFHKHITNNNKSLIINNIYIKQPCGTLSYFVELVERLCNNFYQVILFVEREKRSVKFVERHFNSYLAVIMSVTL